MLDCVQRMLFNHFYDLTLRSNVMNEKYLKVFYRLLGLRESILNRILVELEQNEKVVVRFKCRSQDDTFTVDFNVFHVNKHRWEELFEGLEGNMNGLCISFDFGKGRENQPWYFVDEKHLRGRALAKVFGI